MFSKVHKIQFERKSWAYQAKTLYFYLPGPKPVAWGVNQTRSASLVAYRLIADHKLNKAVCHDVWLQRGMACR